MMPVHDNENWTIHEIQVDSKTRFKIAVDRQAEDPISEDYRNGRYTKTAVTDALLALFKPGMVVLDLGGHIGTITLAAAARGCRVITVEASPRNFALLSKSVETNGFDNVTLVHAAVSDAPGTLYFCAHGPWGHVYSSVTDMPTVSVRAVTVEQILSELDIDRVDLIKIDVEGSEVRAVRGMRKMLAAPDAPPVVYECNGHTLRFYDHTSQEIRGAFADLGYQQYALEPPLLVPATADAPQVGVLVDYLATKQAPEIEGWRLGFEMTHDDMLTRARQYVGGSPEDRVHLADEIQRSSLRNAPAFAAILRQLQQDEDESVRRAAA